MRRRGHAGCVWDSEYVPPAQSLMPAAPPRPAPHPGSADPPPGPRLAAGGSPGLPATPQAALAQPGATTPAPGRRPPSLRAERPPRARSSSGVTAGWANGGAAGGRAGPKGERWAEPREPGGKSEWEEPRAAGSRGARTSFLKVVVGVCGHLFLSCAAIRRPGRVRLGRGGGSPASSP